MQATGVETARLSSPQLQRFAALLESPKHQQGIPVHVVNMYDLGHHLPPVDSLRSQVQQSVSSLFDRELTDETAVCGKSQNPRPHQESPTSSDMPVAHFEVAAWEAYKRAILPVSHSESGMNDEDSAGRMLALREKRDEEERAGLIQLQAKAHHELPATPRLLLKEAAKQAGGSGSLQSVRSSLSELEGLLACLNSSDPIRTAAALALHEMVNQPLDTLHARNRHHSREHARDETMCWGQKFLSQDDRTRVINAMLALLSEKPASCHLGGMNELQQCAVEILETLTPRVGMISGTPNQHDDQVFERVVAHLVACVRHSGRHKADVHASKAEEEESRVALRVAALTALQHLCADIRGHARVANVGDMVLAILSDTSEPAEQVDACKRTCARFPWRVHVCIILPMRQMSVCI